MAKFSKGTQVKQVVTPIEGEVTGFQVDQESGDLQVLVTWTDEHGEHARYFKETEIEAVAG
jgi:hypothetical protein